MKRTTTRILTMMILYQYEITKELNILSVINMIDEEINYDQEFLNNLVNGVVNNMNDIDYKISVNLKKYTIDRLSYIDRNLIRIGVYELLYLKTPESIIINEIVEISKEYSEIEGFESSKFNNSLLDKIAKEMKNGK